MIGIYKIINPEGKIYIGQTRNFEKRIKSYKRKQCYGQTKIYHSILKYGFENHQIKLIVECLETELNEREIFYIKKYKALDRCAGLNIREGGSNGKLSKEGKSVMIEKLKNNHIKNPSILKELAKISGNITRGVKRPKHVVDKIISTKINKGTLKMKQSSIDKMKQTIRKKFDEDPSCRERMKENNKLSSGNKKKVRCILTDRVWDSCKDMCLEMGLNTHYTRKQLSGSRTNFTSYTYVK